MTHTSTIVRLASEADIPSLVLLNGVVQARHAELYPAYFKDRIDSQAVSAFFSARLESSPMHAIAIAEIGQTPAGYAWFERQTIPETPFTLERRRMYLHHLSVVPEARRRGVATALTRYVEEQSLADGIEEVVLDTWAANLDAQRFFRARGFANFRLVFHRRLDPTNAAIPPGPRPSTGSG